MGNVDLSAIQSPRQGYTPVRKARTFSTKNSGLLLWTRRCLLYTGATMIRELEDTILLIGAGELDNVTVDPLSDTRVFKGDSATPGAVMTRFLANDGNGQECKYVAMKNQSINPGNSPNEFLRVDNLLFDGDGAVAAPVHVDVARTSTPTIQAIPAFSTLKDAFLIFTLYLNDLIESDFCSRIQLVPSLAGKPVWDMRLPIPRLLIKQGETLLQQLILGMEVASGVDGFLLLEETAGVTPATCVNVMAYGFDKLCSYRLDQRSPNMKFMKLKDMYNNPTDNLANATTTKNFEPFLPPGSEGSLVRDARPKKGRR